MTRDAAKEAIKNASLLTSHVETFESEMMELRSQLVAGIERLDQSADSVGNSQQSSNISSSSSSSSLPTFDEIESKLSLLRTNLRENPIPVSMRLELEQRISGFGPEVARLKHIQDLKAKDEIAARIYDQLSTGDQICGLKFVVRELQLKLEGKIVCLRILYYDKPRTKF